MAIGAPTLGANPPDVMTPTCVSPAKTGAPSRTGSLPSTESPTSLRAGPLAKAFRMRSDPKNPPSARRRFDTANAALASTGSNSGFMSWPYSGRPASSRNESRAPRPMGFTSGCAQIWSASAFAWAAGTEISKPSSPVYPERLIHSGSGSVLGPQKNEPASMK